MSTPLSADTIATIKATIPVLEENGEALTRYFYDRMFKGHPEVLAYFNPANQTGGTQQRALAAAICAYAKNIDNLGALGAAVELIAQKHASLRILPEQYPIVGEHLLGSISEVLELPMDHAIITSWGEAYGLLADILIGREAAIYEEKKNQPHGWHDFTALTVVDKKQESDVVTSLTLAHPDHANGGKLPAYKPGQYITIKTQGAGAYTTMRQYSLSCAPNLNAEEGCDTYRVSIKREAAPATCPHAPAGLVSARMHDDINVGDSVNVCAPSGEFFYDVEAGKTASRPLVLLSGGIGITPVLAMLHSAIESGASRDIYFVHGALNSSTQAFNKEVRALAAAHPNVNVHIRYNAAKDNDVAAGNCDSTGYVDIALLQSILPSNDCDFYFCGPKPFMVNLYRGLKGWGVPAGQTHFEFFGPLQELEGSSDEVACPIA